MPYVQLIVPDYLFKKNYLPEDINTQLIVRNIQKGQNNIKNILGYNLLSKLMNDFAANGEWTGKYLELMNGYVKPALAEWTYYHILPDLNYRLTNKAVSKKDSEFSEASSLDEVQYLRQIQLNIAQEADILIRDFLKANQSDFPELYSNTDYNFPSVKTSAKIWTRNKRLNR